MTPYYDPASHQLVGVRTAVVLSDIQFPLHDPMAMNVAFATIEHVRPDALILNGDIVDSTLLGEYTKDPRTASLAEEIRLVRELLQAYPAIPVKIWLEGNHEDRWRRFLWKYAPMLDGLVDLPALVKPEEYHCSYLRYGDYVDLGRLMVTHGDVVRKHSGATARAHFEKYGQSVLHGHTHRLGAYYHTNRRGAHGAWENGHLCDPAKMDYVNCPDWQQGFSVVHCFEDGEFSVQQLPILSPGRVFYGGVEITP